jgi:nucleoside-diphosphate-sugar epimerase
MIIGNGLLANAFEEFREDDSTIIFASGVSNSKETNLAAFNRERGLLLECLSLDKKIIYFGTCSVNDLSEKKMPYVQHKLEMEALVSARARKFTIFRLPQVIGGLKNPHTLVNYIYRAIQESRTFELWNKSERNLIDISDVMDTCSYIIKKELFENSIINVASPININIKRLVVALEKILKKNAIFYEVEKGSPLNLDVSSVLDIYKILGICFNENYTENVLRKYYE